MYECMNCVARIGVVKVVILNSVVVGSWALNRFVRDISDWHPTVPADGGAEEQNWTCLGECPLIVDVCPGPDRVVILEVVEKHLSDPALLIDRNLEVNVERG